VGKGAGFNRPPAASPTLPASHQQMRRQILLATILLSFVLTAATGQGITEDTYCIKLRPSSKEKYFVSSNLDSVPVKFRPLYENGLFEWSRLLSRFSEEPIIDVNKEVFRSITFGPFNDLKDVQILRIEKREKDVELTLKIILKLKDSTILVHKKILSLDTWDKFKVLTDKYFSSEPSFKNSKAMVHDGSSTVYEGHILGDYHFLNRHVMSITDPHLVEINRFLLKSTGDIFGPNCKKDTREK
jgi:hypothetical protein